MTPLYKNKQHKKMKTDILKFNELISLVANDIEQIKTLANSMDYSIIKKIAERAESRMDEIFNFAEIEKPKAPITIDQLEEIKVEDLKEGDNIYFICEGKITPDTIIKITPETTEHSRKIEGKTFWLSLVSTFYILNS